MARFTYVVLFLVLSPLVVGMLDGWDRNIAARIQVVVGPT